MSWRSILQKPIIADQEYQENQEDQSTLKSNIPDITGILGGKKFENQIKESAEYIFSERLGISDNEALALDEAFKHIINKLTIQ